METDPRCWLLFFYQTIPEVVMKDRSVTNAKLGSSFMYPVPTCCTQITNIFKYGRYPNLSNAFIQHGRLDLLLENAVLPLYVLSV